MSAIIAAMNNTEENIGIILINTGSPASPEPRDIRAYLIEFLSDKNIIRVPHAIWLPILHGFIARTRPKKTAPRYRQIWTDKGTPLLVKSQAQRDALNHTFAEQNFPLRAEVGMRYGTPSIEDALQSLKHQGCTKFIGFPLFPQTATCTVSTCKEKFLQVVPPENVLGVIEGYAYNPLYWKAIAQSIKDTWTWKPGSKVLFSFHSVPLCDVDAGDTYLEETHNSMSQVANILGLSADDWAIAYHSRFEDSRAWAAPHPKTILASWADKGVSRIALVTPGFAADCLESLYDIASVAKHYFEERCEANKKIPDVTYIPALNSRADHIDLLFDEIVKKAEL